MSTEKTDAIVIRLADFSETSRVVTLFSRRFGKISALAKGAKRLKGPFESALDLLARVRVVFIRKSSGGLDLLTEAQIQERFRPPASSLDLLYAGYYVAELLDGLTEVHDPHPQLFDDSAETLTRLAAGSDFRLTILQFEIAVLREIGQLPPVDSCQCCGEPISTDSRSRYSMTSSGPICADCGRPDEKSQSLPASTIHLLQSLMPPSDATPSTDDDTPSSFPSFDITPAQFKELRQVFNLILTSVLERPPKMLRYLRF
ncbi:MAG: DNA repair protein RecO [Planctomycetaceae bacterium]